MLKLFICHLYLFQNIELARNVQVKVINRWGVEVYNSNSYNNLDENNRWNGDVEGKVAPAGNYIAIIKTDKRTIRQTVTIVK